MKTRSLSRPVVATAVALAAGAAVAQPASAESNAKAGPSINQVYEATNNALGNSVQVFDRAPDGTLVAGAVVPTGGLGTGNSLASQGGIVRDGRRLFVVNAGDNTVTSFAITRDGLSRRDVEPSGGIRPVSVTVHDDVVYVLNTGSDSISGFHINDRGNLTPIANSARALSTTGTGAAEVKFTHDGDALIVTEKATNTIDTFEVSDDGVAGAATFTASVGVVPYGFDIDRRDHVVVSEAATGSVSSYRFDDGALSVTTGALADTQGAPCWLVISTDDRFAYTTNAASGTISSYRIARDGSLTLLAAVAATTGAGPTDVAVSSDGGFLYARVRNGDVATFAITADGSLTSLGSAAGATAIGSSGLVAS